LQEISPETSVWVQTITDKMRYQPMQVQIGIGPRVTPCNSCSIAELELQVKWSMHN
jgi:hypothetical protein